MSTGSGGGVVVGVGKWWPAIILVIMAFAVGLIAGFGGEKGLPKYEAKPVQHVDHSSFFAEANITKYEGSKTCIKCHRDEVVEVFHSYHYQLASVQNDIADHQGILYGGRFTYNDFCGCIFWRGEKPVNWIGYVVLKKAPSGYEDLVGSFTGLTGCSMCHGVGMGLPPSPEPSEAQLGNIDCLACHADPGVYLSGPFGIAKGVRNVTRDEQGVWHYEVKLSIDVIAKNILRTPTKDNCLACHAVSGGGPHLKRPNLSPDLMGSKITEDFDVHIAAGLQCVDCHRVEDHRFPTRSVDTFSREEGQVPSCSDCHGEDPHSGVYGWFLNRFHGRVACQTCHIPLIAHGKYPTDTHRDWSASTFLPEKKRWKFSIPDPETGAVDRWYLDSNVVPVYAWYNGTRQIYVYPEPVEPLKEGPEYEKYRMEPVNGESLGVVVYAKPLGSRGDPNAKIYPFKIHRAVVAYSTLNKTMVPMKVGVAFATGNTTLAYLKGSEATGVKWTPGTYITIVRYMQVNHGVQPAEKALHCLDCHGVTTKRMDWQALGYGIYPKVAFASIAAGPLIILALAVYLWWRRRRA